MWLGFVLAMFEARCVSFGHLSLHRSQTVGGKLGHCPSDAQLRNGFVAVYVSLIIELSPTTAAGHGLNAASSGGISSSKAHNFGSPKRGRHICSLLLPSYISSRDMKYHPIRTVEL